MSLVELRAAVDVSRETIARLQDLEALLRKWNDTINLVSRASLDHLWRRHFLDSAQLWPLLGARIHQAADFGSGAGFPALILAILAEENQRTIVFHLVEADARKAAFLATATRSLALPVEIHNERIERVDLTRCDLVTARAFAPLADLLRHTNRLRKKDGQALFPKGRLVHKELDEARRLWKFEHRLHRSLTDPDAWVVEVGAIDGPS